MAGSMGAMRDPWVIDASPHRGETSWGAYPTYAFHHHTEAAVECKSLFEAPNLNLPEGIDRARFGKRIDLLRDVERQRRAL